MFGPENGAPLVIRIQGGFHILDIRSGNVKVEVTGSFSGLPGRTIIGDGAQAQVVVDGDNEHTIVTQGTGTAHVLLSTQAMARIRATGTGQTTVAGGGPDCRITANIGAVVHQDGPEEGHLPVRRLSRQPHTLPGMSQNINRQPAGVPVGGQFAATAHSEAGISLGRPSTTQLVLPDDPFLGRHARCPEPRPAEWAFGEEASVDAAVGTVMDGPLSRGVVNAQRREAFHGWHDWAMAKAQETKDEAYEDFVMGLRTGAASLYERRLGHYQPGLDRFKHGGTPVYVTDHAIQVSGTKRASFEDREHWRKLLKRTPSDAWHRGHLAAGLVLSGFDGHWGLRDDPEAVVIGVETD